MSKQIQRFAFVPLVTWEQYGQERFPNAVEYNGFVAVNYDSNAQSEEVKALADSTGLEQVHHSVSTCSMLVEAMSSGTNKIYNCTLEVAQEVATSFNGSAQ